MTSAHTRGPLPFLAVMLLWFIAACAAGVTGRLASLPPPLPQVQIAALTLLLISSGVRHTGFNEWLAQVSLRGVVALHVTRFVGVAFLWLYGRGELPAAFALPAGWGDILVATLALVIVVSLRYPAMSPRLLFAWNTLGLIDILGVVFNAARLGLADPNSMRALLEFPLSLVPTFLVPLIIASHVLVFWRLRRLAVAERLQREMPAKRKQKSERAS